MTPHIISYDELLNLSQTASNKTLETALCQKGIVGVSGIPDFKIKSQVYMQAAQGFMRMNEDTKLAYTPNRDAGETAGYELGAEQFKDANGNWHVDDKKASFYAAIPNVDQNKWPLEVNLKNAYLDLGELMFNVGTLLMDKIGLNAALGLELEHVEGCGRMLHYHKEGHATDENPNWCGAHFDHGTFTALLPAYYFKDGVAVEEPDEAGLYIIPSNGQQFEKVNTARRDVLLFQVGEFAQLISNDRIKATKHMVRKAIGGIERFTFALFYDAPKTMSIRSTSILAEDARYTSNQSPDGYIHYGSWHQASLDRYRVL